MKGSHHQDLVRKAQGLAPLRTAVVHPVRSSQNFLVGLSFLSFGAGGDVGCLAIGRCQPR
jgi:hypothetical protein